MATVLLVYGVLACSFGVLLGYAAIRFRVESDPLVDKIDQLLPQTQCGQCGFAGCRPYATAMANNEADINQCPPGGETTIESLAALLQRDAKPLNPENGNIRAKRVAWIDETQCIGCTLCIQACPVDAIVGAAKWMHTVIAAECTGCDLCLPPCPVDCIKMVEVDQSIANWKWSPPTAHGLPAKSANM